MADPTSEGHAVPVVGTVVIDEDGDEAPVAHSDAAPSLFATVRMLVAGNGLAQVLQFAILPVLSRAYAPEAFAALGAVQSVASVLAIVATLQVHLSIPLSPGDAEVRERVSALETLALCVLICALPVAVLAGPVGFAVVAMVVALAVASTHQSVLVLRGRFGLISAFAVSRALSIVVLQLIFALVRSPWGLVIGALAGEVVAAVLLRGASGMPVRPRFNLAQARQVIGALPAFALFGTLQELISVAAFYAPIILFARTYSASVSGQYVMASRLVWAPVVLVSSSIAQVLYHRLGQQPPRALQDLRALMPSRTILVALGVALAASFASRGAVRAVLGSGWDLATQMVPLHVAWGTLFLLSLPARVVLRVRELQLLQLVVDAAVLAVMGLIFMRAADEPLHMMYGLVAIAGAQAGLLTLVVVRALSHSPRLLT